MVGEINENKQLEFLVLHIELEDGAITERNRLQWLDKLDEITKGKAYVCGVMGAEWTPTHLNGENTRAENIRHAEALDRLAAQIKDFANMLRKPDIIYEDELSD